MKRPYEITTLLRIMSTPDETQAAVDQIVAWIEGDEDNDYGNVRRIDRTSLGRRKLAYEIDGQRDGVYIIIYADVEPAHLPELELNLKLFSPLLRHLVIRDEEEEQRRRDELLGRNQPEEEETPEESAPVAETDAAETDEADDSAEEAEDAPATDDDAEQDDSDEASDD